MKVLFDYQTFHMQKFGGISRYFVHLMEEFNIIDQVEYELSLKYSSNTHLKAFNHEFKSFPFVESNNMFLKSLASRTSKIINQKESIKYLRSDQFDIFHPTYYDTYHLGITSKPMVLTVYDMIHEKFSNVKTSEEKRKLCEDATLILAISENTKKDLVEIFNLPEEKIKVTYLAGGFNHHNCLDEVASKLPDRYVLYVGNRNWYKNFGNFLEGMIPILQKDKSLHLVCTGPPFNDEEKKRMSKLKHGIQNRIIHFFPKDEEFYTFYNRALAFVFPTLYEGFGIPTLEAFSADCPVILSHTSSLPEVGGEAASYFDPNNVEDISEKISRVIYDEKLREEMIEKGRLQHAKFSWKKTALSTKMHYESIIQ